MNYLKNLNFSLFVKETFFIKNQMNCEKFQNFIAEGKLG